MKFLVIHDRREVFQEILSILAALGVDEDAVQLAEDGVSARTLMRGELFDVAIIDLTIPHIKGKTEVDYATAEELLFELFQSDTLNTPGDLIGLTREPEALESVNNEIGPHLMSVVHEDSDGAWKQRLGDRISYIQKASAARLRSLNQHFDFDVAIITALDNEFAPYTEIFELSKIRYFDSANTFMFSDKDDRVRRGVICAVGRAGQAPAAALTESMLGFFRPRLCVMSGFCGGLEEKTAAGDIIISESIFDWDSGKWKGKDGAALFAPRPEPITIRNTEVHRVLRRIVQDGLNHHDAILGQVVARSDGRIGKLTMLLGPTASGSAVVADETVISRIEGLNDKMLSVDMEGYGMYYAAANTKVARPEFVMIKSVADFCNRRKGDEDHAVCSFLAAKVVEELVCEHYPFSPEG